jgi:hypothetical protein
MDLFFLCSLLRCEHLLRQYKGKGCDDSLWCRHVSIEEEESLAAIITLLSKNLIWIFFFVPKTVF